MLAFAKWKTGIELLSAWLVDLDKWNQMKHVKSTNIKNSKPLASLGNLFVETRLMNTWKCWLTAKQCFEFHFRRICSLPFDASKWTKFQTSRDIWFIHDHNIKSTSYTPLVLYKVHCTRIWGAWACQPYFQLYRNSYFLRIRGIICLETKKCQPKRNLIWFWNFDSYLECRNSQNGGTLDWQLSDSYPMLALYVTRIRLIFIIKVRFILIIILTCFVG